METRARKKAIDKLCSEVSSSNWEAVKTFINEQNNVSKQIFKVCAMHAVCGNIEVPPDDIMLLLKDVINTLDDKGLTPLMTAVLKGNSAIILKLIEYGADTTMLTGQMIRITNTKHRLDVLCLAILFGGDFDAAAIGINAIKLTSEAFAALIHPST